MDEIIKKQRGGARANAGRMKKDELITLIDTMDAITIPDSVWIKLSEKVDSGDVNAIKIWLQYRYGMPKQVVDQHNTHDINTFSINEVFKIK